MVEVTNIDASKARNNFFNILMRAYKGEVFLIKKAGIPVAKISKPSLDNKRSILDFAGALKKINDKKLIKRIYNVRKDSLIFPRKLPAI